MRLASLFYIIVAVSSYAQSGYLDNHSCDECHEKIYDEFQHSAHAKSIFSDALHRKIAKAANPKQYECAACHMPMADNLADLVAGKARPDPHNKTHTDGVSCFFCHTIAYVKKSHRFNQNLPARQAKGYKPTLYGLLKNPDDSDKHSSVKSPIYDKMACMGCHAHKVNENNVTIFQAMDDAQDSRECIRCHMPPIHGGSEKMNKRARHQHARHDFLGIRDPQFRATGYDINVSRSADGLEVKLVNKMGHPAIIQPARAKYLSVEVFREGKRIWRNYRKDPEEDKPAYFVYHFFRNGKPVALPTHATSSRVNNLAAKAHVTFHYTVPHLRSGDRVQVSFYARLAKKECSGVVTLKQPDWTKPMLIKRIAWRVP